MLKGCCGILSHHSPYELRYKRESQGNYKQCLPKFRNLLKQFGAKEVEPREIKELIILGWWHEISCFVIDIPAGRIEVLLYSVHWGRHPYITVRPPKPGLQQQSYYLESCPDRTLQSVANRIAKIIGVPQKITTAQKHYYSVCGD